MSLSRPTALGRCLNHAPLLLFALVLTVFGCLSPRFLGPHNLVNIVVQSSSAAIVATGMTFVLITAGVDLSVGAIMFVGAAVAGKLVAAGAPFPMALAAMLATGLAIGSINALLISRLRIVAFVATLGTLYLGRGFALGLTETRALNLPPETFPALTSSPILGLPGPIALLLPVLIIAHLVLTRTPFGRQLHAIGSHAESARRAGVNVPLLVASVYLISGFCAALGGVITLGQLGAVSPKFGENREFTAIAAAVLGGTSLFGGRGQVLPGTLLGALLMQSVENGLVILNADPYLYPVVTSAVIFVAVLVDSVRTQWLSRLQRRHIIPEARP